MKRHRTAGYRLVVAGWRALLFMLCVPCVLLGSVEPALAELRINVDDLAFGEAGEREFLDGQVVRLREPVWWESDAPWLIMVEALDPNLGVSDDGSYAKPLGDLQFKLSEESQWTRIRQDPEELKSSSELGSGLFTVDWRVLMQWTKDLPGDYAATLRFTILET